MLVTFPQGKRMWKEMVPGGFLLITFCDDAMVEMKAAGTWSSCLFTSTVKQRDMHACVPMLSVLNSYTKLKEGVMLHRLAGVTVRAKEFPALLI